MRASDMTGRGGTCSLGAGGVGLGYGVWHCSGYGCATDGIGSPETSRGRRTCREDESWGYLHAVQVRGDTSQRKDHDRAGH